MTAPNDSGKKRRSFHLFGSKKDKDQETQPAASLAPDSAYASSENSKSAQTKLSSDTVPVDNHGQIEGVDKSRNIALNKSTGNVFDEDTGEIVSTVTTTTTTTTITTTKGGGRGETKVDIATHSPNGTSVNSNLQQSSTNNNKNAQRSNTRDSAISEMPANEPRQAHSMESMPPEPPAKDMSPIVPTRNPNRKSQEVVSPISGPATSQSDLSRANFSYPSRGGPASILGPDDQHFKHHSTTDNLKLAASGIYGVGETLRGTLNNEIDTRFPRRNAEKAAAANAKNQAVIDDGRRHIPDILRPGRNAAINAPDRQHPSNSVFSPSGRPDPSNGRTYQPSAGLAEQGPVNPTGYVPPSVQHKEPVYYLDGLEGADNSKRSGFGKLLKRKPLK